MDSNNRHRTMGIICLMFLCALFLIACGYGIVRIIEKKDNIRFLGNKYDLTVAGKAPSLYPTVIKAGMLWYSQNEALRVPPAFPFSGEWGGMVNADVLSICEKYPMPKSMDLLWLSLTECKCYYLAEDLRPEMEEMWSNTVEEDGKCAFSHIVVGMAPYGKVALWMSGSLKSILIEWMKGREVPEMADRFIPEDVNMTLQEYCDSYISGNQMVQENLKNCGLPPQDLFDGYMQQFRYRYVVCFEDWDEQGVQDSKGCIEHWKRTEMEEGNSSFELSYLCESLYDGTFDKLNDGRLLSYHIGGKPHKLRVDWHLGESEYSAFFWIDYKIITDVFSSFYGPHTDTDTDFLIRIDPVKKKYELSLYGCGLRQPLLIPEEAYQILVFKNSTGLGTAQNDKKNNICPTV